MDDDFELAYIRRQRANNEAKEEILKAKEALDREEFEHFQRKKQMSSAAAMRPPQHDSTQTHDAVIRVRPTHRDVATAMPSPSISTEPQEIIDLTSSPRRSIKRETLKQEEATSPEPDHDVDHRPATSPDPMRRTSVVTDLPAPLEQPGRATKRRLNFSEQYEELPASDLLERSHDHDVHRRETLENVFRVSDNRPRRVERPSAAFAQPARAIKRKRVFREEDHEDFSPAAAVDRIAPRKHKRGGPGDPINASFPSVVRTRDGVLVEIRCIHIGCGATGYWKGTMFNFFAGTGGLQTHYRQSEDHSNPTRDELLMACVHRELNEQEEAAVLDGDKDGYKIEHIWDLKVYNSEGKRRSKISRASVADQRPGPAESGRFMPADDMMLAPGSLNVAQNMDDEAAEFARLSEEHQMKKMAGTLGLEEGDEFVRRRRAEQARQRELRRFAEAQHANPFVQMNDEEDEIEEDEESMAGLMTDVLDD